MKTILALIRKEFLQIFRNRAMLPIIFGIPIVQLLILVNAATFDLKHIPMHVVDRDYSGTSRELTAMFTGSPFFTVESVSVSVQSADDALLSGRADVVLYITDGLERSLMRDGTADLPVTVNGINSNSAGLIMSYMTSIITDYNMSHAGKVWPAARYANGGIIQTHTSFWYNAGLTYSNYMVPGILVLLITIITMFLSSMNIVREKETGTLEQLNVTPVKKYQFIAGKLIPIWILGLCELAFGLSVGLVLFHVPVAGSLPLVFGMAAVYLIVILAFGLLISTVNNTQQQAMFVSFFFMIIFILMSGLFTPLESIPGWARAVNFLNPVKYFITIMRAVLLKGSGFTDIHREFFILLVYGCVLLALAVWRYRKHAR